MAQFDWHVLEIIYMNLENFKTPSLLLWWQKQRFCHHRISASVVASVKWIETEEKTIKQRKTSPKKENLQNSFSVSTKLCFLQQCLSFCWCLYNLHCI